MTTFSIGLVVPQLDAIIKWVKTIKPNRTRGEYIIVQPLKGALKFTCIVGQVKISKQIEYNYPDHVCGGDASYCLPTQEFIKAVDSVKAQWKAATGNIHNLVKIYWVNKVGSAPVTVSTESYFQNQIQYFKFKIYHNDSEIGACSKNESPYYLYSNRFFIDAGELLDLLKRALLFIDCKDPRPYLNGVYFNYSHNGFFIAATDGRHLFSQQRIPLKISNEDGNILAGSEGIIPAKAVVVLVRQLDILLKNKKHAATHPDVSIDLSTSRELNDLTNKYEVKDFSGENITFSFQGRFSEFKFTVDAQLIPDEVYPRLSEIVPHYLELKDSGDYVGFDIDEQSLDLIKLGIGNNNNVKLTIDLKASKISLDTDNGTKDCFIHQITNVTVINELPDLCFNSKLLNNAIKGMYTKSFEAYIHKDAFVNESYNRTRPKKPLVLIDKHTGTTCVVGQRVL